MKKLLLFAFAVLAFAACTQNDVEELSANRADVPEILTVGFEGGDDTRIQLNEAQKTVWTKDDLVSVFYRSDANQKWQYQGETGEREGNLKRLENAVGTTNTTKTIVVYPYSENYWLNADSYYIDATLPAVQHYAEDSYGVGDNLMVSQSEFTQFSLKSVCGWLKIQLTGNGERVTHLTLKGNNGEQLAGLVYVDTATAEATLATEMGSSDDNNAGGNLVFDDAIVTELTLNCGEGVVLGSAAKSFYIAVPPQTFKQGFTVEVECDNGTSTTKSTSEPITIERNHIQPMEAIEYDGVLPEVYELAYRTNDGKALAPYTTEGFGGEFEENIFDVATGEGKLVFAGAITTIPDNAFGLCENLTWIEIPLGVTSIGASAFSGCSSMVEITIPASVTSVGSEAFKGCTGKAYINCSGVSFSGARFAEVVIGDSVTTIGRDAFEDCDSLTSVTIGDSVTTIGDYAFYDCYSLTSVTIPDSVTTIGNRAFFRCDSLTSITIPDSVTTIGWSAFYWCSSLTSVTIPDSVTTIGDSAFSDCYSLTSVYCEATTPPAGGSWMFDSNASDRKIYVPEESVRQYKIAAGWSEYADAIIGYDFENPENNYATLEVTGPSIEAEGFKYNVYFNVKTNDKAADIKVGAQLWDNYEFEKYWDENDWSQIQAFFLFRTSISAESLAAAKTTEGATISFPDIDKDDYVFFFEVLTENNTPTQFAIRVTPDMFE